MYSKYIYIVCVFIKIAEIDVYFHSNKSLFLPVTIKVIFRISYYCE